MKGKESHCVMNFATFLPKTLLYTSIKSENGCNKVVIELSAGVLLEARTWVLSTVPVFAQMRSQVHIKNRQIQNQKLD